METAFDRYMQRGLKVPRRRPPRVAEYWHLLEQMQRHIDGGATPHAAAVMLARKDWRSISKSYEACIQWLEDNQKKFRADLKHSTLLERLQERNAWLDREHPNWGEELMEREVEAIVESNRQWAQDHAEEIKASAEKADAAARAEGRAELLYWFEQLEQNPDVLAGLKRLLSDSEKT